MTDHASVSAGARVVTGEVVRRGRTVAFLRAQAPVDGVIVATGQVTATVLAVAEPRTIRRRRLPSDVRTLLRGRSETSRCAGDDRGRPGPPKH